MSTKRKHSQAAMSLMEMMVAMGISGVILVAVTTLSFYTARSFAALSNYTSLDQQSQYTLDRLTKTIRQATGVAEYSDTNIVLDMSPDPPVQFAYVAADQKFVEISDNAVTDLLTECSALQFDIYQRNTQSGTFNQFPHVSSTNTAKIVQVSWTCTREILGSKVNSESIQSAKIVIRK